MSQRPPPFTMLLALLIHRMGRCDTRQAPEQLKLGGQQGIWIADVRGPLTRPALQAESVNQRIRLTSDLLQQQAVVFSTFNKVSVDLR